MTHPNKLARYSALAVRIGMLLNGCLLAAIGIGLIASLVLGDKFTQIMLSMGSSSDIGDMTWGIRCLMMVGVLAFAVTQSILVLLHRIVVSVAGGDPFAQSNSARIRFIAWALLAIQLLDFPLMAIRHTFSGLEKIVPDNGLSLSGWLAVLMLFVLARIFATGTSMQDYLNETI